MAIYMELNIANLEILKDLGFKLSITAENHRIGVHSSWGKHISIRDNTILIHPGDMYSYQLIPISKASEVLTLQAIGMTPQEIFKTLRQDQHVVLTPNLN